MLKIIIVEGDELLRRQLEQQLCQLGHQVASTSSLAGAQDWLTKDDFDLILADAKLPDSSGSHFYSDLEAHYSRPLVVILADQKTAEIAANGAGRGAFDVLLKPFSDGQIEATVSKAEAHWRLLQIVQVLSQAGGAGSRIDLIGHSPALDQLRHSVRKIARTQATVLVRGERGSGKGKVARALHRQSPRADAPLLEADCAVIPENVIEHTLFGSGKAPDPAGSARRPGLFALAHGGTLILEEIGALPMGVQAGLLRVLQQQELECAHGKQAFPVDVRVIATSSRHLEEMVKRHQFREDLFHRLNIVPILVPPLRDRREDIPLLADQFRQLYCRKLGKEVLAISPVCLNVLQAHSWPGNVRELQFLLERAVAACPDGSVLEPAHLGMTDAESSAAKSNAAVSTNDSGEAAGIDTLGEIEKKHIFVVLEKCRGNRTHAAKYLGISIRTLRNKLKEYRTGLDTSSSPPVEQP